MEKKSEIPCTSCQSWNRKEKKFSCNPEDCKELTTWLSDNAPQLCKGSVQMQVHIPEVAIKYVV
jgi:hypothetical protein